MSQLFLLDSQVSLTTCVLASTKMYKSRFRLWGIEKNASVTRILSTLGKAQLDGKDSERFKSYLQRLTEPRRKEVLKALTSQLSDHPNEFRSLPPPLSPPDEILFPERCIRELGPYVEQCYQIGLWQRNDILGLKLEDTVPSWCKFVWQASCLLKEGKTGKANHLLWKFVIECPQQLVRHDPRLFQFLYTSIISFSLRFPQYAAELLKAFRLASQNLLRRHPTHPLQPLILILSRIGPENMLHWGSRILLAYIDYIKKSLGGVWPVVLDMLEDILYRLIHHGLMDPQEALKIGNGMALAAELEHHNRSQPFLELKVALSGCYLLESRYSEGRRVLHEVMTLHDPNVHSELMLVRLHIQMAKLYDGEGMRGKALESALRAVTLSIPEFDQRPEWTATSLGLLHELHQKVGHAEEADKVMRDYDYTVEKMCD